MVVTLIEKNTKFSNFTGLYFYTFYNILHPEEHPFPAELIDFPNSKVCLTREWTIGPTDDVFWLSKKIVNNNIKNSCLLVLCWSPLFIRIENAGSLSNISLFLRFLAGYEADDKLCVRSCLFGLRVRSFAIKLKVLSKKRQQNTETS